MKDYDYEPITKKITITFNGQTTKYDEYADGRVYLENSGANWSKADWKTNMVKCAEFGAKVTVKEMSAEEIKINKEIANKEIANLKNLSILSRK